MERAQLQPIYKPPETPRPREPIGVLIAFLERCNAETTHEDVSTELVEAAASSAAVSGNPFPHTSPALSSHLLPSSRAQAKKSSVSSLFSTLLNLENTPFFAIKNWYSETEEQPPPPPPEGSQAHDQCSGESNRRDPRRYGNIRLHEGSRMVVVHGRGLVGRRRKRLRRRQDGVFLLEQVPNPAEMAHGVICMYS
ncbi:hypothetical protein Salat_2883800, partial [Sesamum alatum]